MEEGGLDDLAHQRARRVEGGCRALCHIGYAVAAELAQTWRIKRGDVALAHPDRAAGDRHAGTNIAEERKRDRRLA
jgi:hypothetical protein